MIGKTKTLAEERQGQVDPLTEADAANARMALVGLSLYPTKDLGEDPDYTVAEANWRAELHQMVDRLDCTDLAAVVELVRPLVQVQRDLDIFKRIAQRSVRIMLLAGFSLPVDVREVTYA